MTFKETKIFIRSWLAASKLKNLQTWNVSDAKSNEKQTREKQYPRMASIISRHFRLPVGREKILIKWCWHLDKYCHQYSSGARLCLWCIFSNFSIFAFMENSQISKKKISSTNRKYDVSILAVSVDLRIFSSVEKIVKFQKLNEFCGSKISDKLILLQKCLVSIWNQIEEKEEDGEQSSVDAMQMASSALGIYCDEHNLTFLFAWRKNRCKKQRKLSIKFVSKRNCRYEKKKDEWKWSRRRRSQCIIVHTNGNGIVNNHFTIVRCRWLVDINGQPAKKIWNGCV